MITAAKEALASIRRMKARGTWPLPIRKDVMDYLRNNPPVLKAKPLEKTGNIDALGGKPDPQNFADRENLYNNPPCFPALAALRLSLNT
jgi:hypothetical protein